MAKYQFSLEGVEQLRELARKLEQSNAALNECGERLVSDIQKLDGLGIYWEYIIEMGLSIQNRAAAQTELVDYMSFSLHELANQMERLLPPEAFNGSGDDDDTPPPHKVLVKKR